MNLSRLLIKKSVARIQAEGQSSGLKRTLTRWNLVSLGIGCIIGAGIFVMTGKAAAEHAGPAIMLSFVAAGLACAFAGLCYAEMASVLPVSGSAYTYAYATLGEVFAWSMGWLLVLEYGISASTVAVGWSGYLTSFLCDFGILIPYEWANAPGEFASLSPTCKALLPAGYVVPEGGGIFNAVSFFGIVMVTVLLSIGISESAKVNNVIVFIKVAVVIAFVAIGAFYVNPDNWVPFIPENEGPGKYGWEGVLRGASIIFFAYIGFEAVSTAAQEAKNPQKDMPFGILVSLGICTVLYMLVAGVLTGLIPYAELAVKDPVAKAVDSVGLGWFSFAIKVGAIMGLSSVMLVLCYGQTRIFYTMARDGLIPKAFAKVNRKTQTPLVNTLMVGTVVALTASLMPLSKLGDLTSLGTLAAFCMVCFATIWLRITEPALERPFRVPYNFRIKRAGKAAVDIPIIAVLGVLSCGYLMAQMPMEIFIKLKVFFAVGILIYLFYGIKHSRLAQGLNPHESGGEFVVAPHENRTE